MSSDYKFDVIIIGGFGHVGLPLGIVLADLGLQVGLYDIDHDKRPMIESGTMPFIEYDAEPLLQRVIGKNLHIVENLEEIKQSEYVIVTIGTPVDEYHNPKLQSVLNLAEQLKPFLLPHHCVILRSTVYPGTTKSLRDFFEQSGIDVHLAYCPERIVQGYAIRELQKLPQIISGFTNSASQMADKLFRRLGVDTVHVSVQEAELAKLFSNSWRYIQFAITNQFYMIATEWGADYDKIRHAMTHKYERDQDFPGPGFCAGPCLLKDTLQLGAFYGNHFQLGQAAMVVNEGLPNFLVRHIEQDLKLDLDGRPVGILGMAFKSNIDDIRDSLSYKLAKVLRFHGAHVMCSDEYVQDPSFVSKEKLVAECSVIIVGVPHSVYRGFQISEDTHVIDLWGIIKTEALDK